MKYPEDFINRIICGDCLEVMKIMPDNCIDTIITDPPYNLSTIKRFKAKDSGEKWNVKSGVFHRTSKGFMGQEWDNEIAFQIETWEAVYRISKPGTTLLCFGGTRTYHRLACAIEDAGWIIKDTIMWLYGSGFPKATDISKQIDKMEGKINIIGEQKASLGISDHGREPKYKRENITKRPITAPATPEATLWNGWKSHGLKPAYEPILVAMKTNEGSYANNALKYGVAGLNIDGGRINHNEPLKETNRQKNMGNSWDKNNCGLRNNPNNIASANQKGRFPANVILDEEASRLLDEQSGKNCGAFAPVKKAKRPSNVYGEYKNFGDNGRTFRDDTGGASRFFYCAKASKAERNRGCENLEEKSNMRVNAPRINEEAKTANKMGNHHPTVKPLSLMKYLCTLTKTPTGGIVLDPFCGSGTTLMACKELKRDYIGIDNNPEYCEIARKRVDSTPEYLF